MFLNMYYFIFLSQMFNKINKDFQFPKCLEVILEKLSIKIHIWINETEISIFLTFKSFTPSVLYSYLVPLLADDQVLIRQEYEHMEFMVRKLFEEYEKWSLKINLEKTFYMGCGAATKDLLILEDQKGCIRECEEFKYLGVQVDEEDRQENDIKDRINIGRAMLNSVLWNRQITRKNKLLIYNSIVKSTVTYGDETWKFNKNLQ